MQTESGPRSHDLLERLSRLLHDEKSLIGLANSFGGLLVCIAYQVMQ